MKKRLPILAAAAFLMAAMPLKAIETTASHALLMDADTGYVMLDKQAHQPMPPASMSKLMTAYMVFEALQAGELSLEDEWTVSANAWRKGGAKSGGSTMFLEPNQTVKVKDLLRGIIVQSGNDACIVIAENMAGSEEVFAALMTAKGKEIGLESAVFKNATGLPEAGHAMSAYDLALLARKIISTFPEYYSIYSEREFAFNGIKQGNRNPLLYALEGADGLKTGHTEGSGYGLTGSVKTPDGRRLIVVLNGLRSMTDRATESRHIIGWGQSAFENISFYQTGAVVDLVPVWLGKSKTVPAVLKEPAAITLMKGQRGGLEATIRYNAPVKAPVKKGQELGSVSISSNGEVVKTVPLVAAEDVARTGYLGKLKAVISRFIGG